MNNIKKLIMGFAAAALMLSFSAFKPVSTAKVPTIFYALNEAGTEYRLVGPDPTGLCINDPTLDKCVIGYEAENAPSEEVYPADDHPTPDYESTTTGWFED